ncbi:hypothetical protein ACFWYW_39455 [Nonomuraea sp. NPDC059023]|uniref:hypothetical protein n=1 Tax=unclassified Nonomuraea TaxID=2593643 RepID=UPI00369FE231
MIKLSAKPASIVAGVLLTVTAVLSFSIVSRGAASTVPQAGSPLDDIPGLGVSDAAAQRDEIISFWEAWKRDTSTQRCMAAAGLEWRPETLYIEKSVLGVANALGVQPTPGSLLGQDPEQYNEALATGLKAEKKDTYYQTLFGESAEAIAYFEANDGAIPLGSDPEAFAQHGCKGDADRSVGSIWSLKAALADPIDRLRASARETDAFKQGVSVYQQCLASKGINATGPADLDIQAENATTDTDVLHQAATTCDPLWQQANDAGVATLTDQFRKEHATPIASQQAKYAGTLDAIRADKAFHVYLAEAAGQARAKLSGG